MNKDDIFKEFKKNQELKKEQEEIEKETQDEVDKKELENVDAAITKETIEGTDDTTEEIDEENNEEEQVDVEEDEAAKDILSPYDDPKFKEFKEEFFKSERNQTLILFFKELRDNGETIFEDDYFILQKMLNPKIQMIILEPSEGDIALGKKSVYYLIKPVTPKEYQNFIIKFQSKEKNPEEYMKFIIESGVIYPNNSKLEYNERYTSGEAITLYDTIVNISDLNKRYRIIEV